VRVYYNDHDPYCAQWLRNLIARGLLPDGDVDERDIRRVRPRDLRGYQQVHLFAGIGGWPYALRLAEWPAGRAVWTASVPCQPFSSAARGRAAGADDPRDLWPATRRLVASVRPATIFGEQVAHGDGWVTRACHDLEEMDYDFGAAVLPACSVGFDHARPRTYFVGHANGDGKPGMQVNAEVARLPRPRGKRGGVVPADGVSARVAQFSAFGNAIVPHVAAEFIRAARDAIGL
jgi:DNA (cytosine-5)-methyltransferase 1